MNARPFANASPIRRALALVITGICFCAAVAFAGEGSTSKPSATTLTKTKPKKEPTRMVTGSMIPQKVDRLGNHPTTHFPAVIIDRREIDRSGRTTVAAVLSRHPSFR
jgi:hypothetical protein